ncbi:response regulator [Cytophagales bacterium LB-30]|uniref:Response regulator n=1 Tax=Shiella aurantiaca TaxID=3058365 RepID=A0ABT8F7A7_9BACT|nr:response regulator [Shiella aurantiaca]MDN4166124.1 response regulator [Shiella aurantiaca]
MRKTIMTVDDSESILAVVSTTLEEEYDVITVSGGKEALEQLEKGINIDLIITDLNMPLVDGIEVIKKARSISQYSLKPILMLTTESQAQKKLEAKEAGATGWIVKPFEPEKLKEVVKKVIR